MSTLIELNVKPGDVVSYGMGEHKHRIVSFDGVQATAVDLSDQSKSYLDNKSVYPWFVVSRASNKPVLWKDMTPEQKGAILLAAHEGKVIQYWSNCHEGVWLDCVSVSDDTAYRIKPEPVVEIITQYWKTNKNGQFVPMHMNSEPAPASEHNPTHKITFNVVDGEPDVTSIRMEHTK